MRPESHSKYLTLSVIVHSAVAWGALSVSLLAGDKDFNSDQSVEFVVAELSSPVKTLSKARPKKAKPIVKEQAPVAQTPPQKEIPLLKETPVEVVDTAQVDLARPPDETPKPSNVPIEPIATADSKAESPNTSVGELNQVADVVPVLTEDESAESTDQVRPVNAANEAQRVNVVKAERSTLPRPLQRTQVTQEEMPMVSPLRREPSINESRPTWPLRRSMATNLAKNSAEGRPGSSIGMRSYQDLRQMPGNQAPQYPSASRMKREEGNILIKYFVTANGGVSQLQLLRSSGHARLDEEALQAASRYRFVPGQQGWTLHPVSFILSGKDEVVGGRLRTSLNNYK